MAYLNTNWETDLVTIPSNPAHTGSPGVSPQASPADHTHPTGLTTKGDILTDTGAAVTKVTVGTNNQVLSADSTQTSGLLWKTITDNVNGPGIPTHSGSAGTSVIASPADHQHPSGLSSKGDLLTDTGSALSVLGVGAANFVLMANTNATAGIQWANNAQPYGIYNLAFSVTMNGDNTCTVALVDQTAAALTTTNLGQVNFRSNTLTSSNNAISNISTSPSVLLPAGFTAGQTQNGAAVYMHVWLIRLSPVVIGVSAVGPSFISEAVTQTTVAIAGAGAGNASTIYSTAAQSNKGVRYLGRFLSTQATAGNWVTTPSEISIYPLERQTSAARATSSVGTTIAVTDTLVTFGTKDYDTQTEWSTSTNLFTAKEAGAYNCAAKLYAAVTGSSTAGTTLVGTWYINGAAKEIGFTQQTGKTNSDISSGTSVNLFLNAGDTVGFYAKIDNGTYNTTTSGTNASSIQITKVR